MGQIQRIKKCTYLFYTLFSRTPQHCNLQVIANSLTSFSNTRSKTDREIIIQWLGAHKFTKLYASSEC